MVICGECDNEFKSQAGLVSHQRHRHSGSSEPQQGGRNLRAARQTLAELSRLGRLEKIDAVKREALLSIAAAVDENPFNSQMWREYREQVREVMDVGDEDSDDVLAAALASLGGVPKVGDS